MMRVHRAVFDEANLQTRGAMPLIRIKTSMPPLPAPRATAVAVTQTANTSPEAHVFAVPYLSATEPRPDLAAAPFG
jgi:hypothetical protein